MSLPLLNLQILYLPLTSDIGETGENWHHVRLSLLRTVYLILSHLQSL